MEPPLGTSSPECRDHGPGSCIPPDTRLAGRTLPRKTEFPRDWNLELDSRAQIRGHRSRNRVRRQRTVSSSRHMKHWPNARSNNGIPMHRELLLHEADAELRVRSIRDGPFAVGQTEGCAEQRPTVVGGEDRFAEQCDSTSANTLARCKNDTRPDKSSPNLPKN